MALYEVPTISPTQPAEGDSKTQGAPMWWVQRLHKKLVARLPTLKKYSAYYDGAQPLELASPKFRRAFGGLFDRFSDNWCGVVVDAAAERIEVQGFRYPGQEPKPPEQADPVALEEAFQGDADAWEIWQRSGLDAGSQILQTEALVEGCAYALVWPENGDEVRITPESAEQMIVATEPGSGRRLAAYKEWWDEDSGYLNATLYLPNEVRKYRSKDKVQNGGDLGQAENIQWAPRDVPDERWPLPNPLGEVPVVPFENRPRLTRAGISEIVGVVPIQDAVNKILVDMLVASEYQSFRQRWVTGLDIPIDPDTGEALEPFKMAVDRLLIAEDKDVQFGDFGTVDLEQFVKAAEMLVQHIASQTRTPPHYFYLAGQFPSGESLVSAEAGLVKKSVRKMRDWGEAYEEVLRLSFKAKGDPRAEVYNSETIWGDPESRNPAVIADAATKMLTVGVPPEAIWEYMGFSPQQIARFKAAGAKPPEPSPPSAPAPPPENPPSAA